MAQRFSIEYKHISYFYADKATGLEQCENR